MGFMNARKLILMVVALLLWIASSASIAAPVVLAEELCPNAASRQGPSAALPDCRAYEQVTPADKGDAQDLFPSSGLEKSTSATENNGYAAEDGNRFLLFAESSFVGGNSNHSSYVFTRGTTGWTTQSLSPGPGVHGIEAKVFNPNLTEVGVEDLQYPHLPGQAETPIDADYVGPVGGPYTTVSSLSYLEAAGEETLAGASADMSHVIIQTKDHALAPGADGQDEGSNALYESFEGQLRLVNVTTSGSLLSPCGAQLGQGGSKHFFETAGLTHNAVSSDGSKIFFTAPDPAREQEGAGCWNATTSPQENPPELYMRLDSASTVEISAPNTGVHDPDGPQPAVYVGASADGSKVFFVTKAELTADDTGHALELYEYDTEAPEGERLVRVSSGESGTAEGNIDFVGAVFERRLGCLLHSVWRPRPGCIGPRRSKRLRQPLSLRHPDQEDRVHRAGARSVAIRWTRVSRKAGTRTYSRGHPKRRDQNSLVSTQTRTGTRLPMGSIWYSAAACR